MASILDLISAVLIAPPLLRGGRTGIGAVRRVEAVLKVSCFRWLIAETDATAVMPVFPRHR
jgi:hypothetical protein